MHWALLTPYHMLRKWFTMTYLEVRNFLLAKLALAACQIKDSLQCGGETISSLKWMQQQSLKWGQIIVFFLVSSAFLGTILLRSTLLSTNSCLLMCNHDCLHIRYGAWVSETQCWVSHTTYYVFPLFKRRSFIQCTLGPSLWSHHDVWWRSCLWPLLRSQDCDFQLKSD